MVDEIIYACDLWNKKGQVSIVSLSSLFRAISIFRFTKISAIFALVPCDPY